MKITRFEVVRIRPQIEEGEAVEKLIEDPWKVIPCNDMGNGCQATFSDLNLPPAIAWRPIMCAPFKSLRRKSMLIICAALMTMTAIVSRSICAMAMTARRAMMSASPKWRARLVVADLR